MSKEGKWPLKAAIGRLEEALKQSTVDRDVCEVRASDVRLLFETIKDYGGRKDWTPSDQNLAKLPQPVLRHIVRQWREIRRQEQEIIKLVGVIRKLEEHFRIIEHAPR